ncbi:hypothetical protein A6R68_19892 [Neotoma lepida]|uniref:Protein-tyrosine sulfotransferase n=1 Tax=Neotoma lepida TaxID=56216 RepID=A0A1A6HIC8_NEOLE|nr:hypothetical protein A6R68_19892 [Neotoma lepida]
MRLVSLMKCWILPCKPCFWRSLLNTGSQRLIYVTKKCMLVHYEQLVLHSEQWMRMLLKFLHIPWDHSVLHHEEMIGKAGRVSLSKVDRSTDQVTKPVNMVALSKWVGKIPLDVLQDMTVIVPMLGKFGYDPCANPPNYRKPDPKILENTRRVYKSEFQLPNFLKEKP